MHYSALETIIRATGEALEGNCVYENLTFQQSPLLASKRRNLAKAAKGAQRICEIGFNAGHSALEFLEGSLTNATYVFFDLGEHAYSAPCANYIQSLYPTRILEFVWGDSRTRMPQWIAANPTAIGTFDVVHVDGGHTSECATSDMFGAYLLTKPGGILIVDDISSPVIMQAVNVWMRQGLLHIDPSFEVTKLYTHAVLRKV
jgi:predicted O-methyltransferase YrrM